jgi:murein L,D-transpeptidase YcbB/YkuD
MITSHNPKQSFIVWVLLSFLLAACRDSGSEAHKTAGDSTPRDLQITAADIAGNFSTPSALKIDSSMLDSFFIQYPLLRSPQKSVRSFYRGRNFSAAWHDSVGLIEQAGSLFNRMQNVEAEGLSVQVPYLSEADSLMSNEDPGDMRSATRTDLLLTGMYFYFAEKVWGGLSEARVREINWYLPRKKINYEARLDSLLRAPVGTSEADEPVYRQYGLLKKALEKYQAIAKANEWPAIVIDKKFYTTGDSANPIAMIKKRLYLLGDMTVASETPIFDPVLAAAVNKFRRRFGMKETGIIDQPLINELNVPLKKRIEQIIVNIERSRWLPDQIEGNYIAVNIPGFRLHVCHGDSVLWSMNVVVGKTANKTVIFSGNLQYVVFSPYWNVPTSILNKEVLPGIRRDKNYLAKHHMEWNGKSVRQKPGPWNSLGKVKFLFPNSYSIYLHDTPSKSLFAEDKRAFSHGCIRVGEPGKLARYLLQNEVLWTDKKIDDAMNSGKEQYVKLKQPVPVFIGYLTAWVDLRHDGEVNFRNDVYGRDGRLAKMLEK